MLAALEPSLDTYRGPEGFQWAKVAARSWLLRSEQGAVVCVSKQKGHWQVLWSRAGLILHQDDFSWADTYWAPSFKSLNDAFSYGEQRAVEAVCRAVEEAALMANIMDLVFP